MARMRGGGNAWQESTAGRLVERMRLRAELNEGIGIHQVWRVCGQSQARDELRTEHGDTGQGAEARRMIAAVDEAADRRGDPDVRWN